MNDLDKRPDRKNLRRFLAHGERTSYGTSWVKIKWQAGNMASYTVEKVEEGSQAPLEKDNGNGSEGGE